MIKTLARICAFTAILFSSIGAAWAQANDIVDVNIRGEQPLGEALQSFADQTDLQVIFFSEVADGKESAELSGEYKVSTALDTLLADTGLTYTLLDEHSVSVQAGSESEPATPGKSQPAPRPVLIAQNQSQVPQNQIGRTNQSANDQNDERIEQIVVTGSRITRSGLATPTPTVIVGVEEIEASGAVNIGDLLRELPAIGPGINAESTAATFSGAGLNLIDLRSLGTERTLVLVNGRRHVGSQPSTTAVDLNTIPTPLVERVEVITGGASAVYGADAVSGVVNIILKDDFQGLEFDVQTGVSDRSDAERYQVGVTAGTNFAEGDGNVVLHLSYADEGGIEFDARPGGVSGANWVANPANTGPNDGIDDFIIMRNLRQLAGQQES
ncbi:MAG: TonB-dependent receptor, partial [Sphingomonadales bacterium]|nr:TonB-dependent receptor [Sphingomonadales bacterium]